MSEIAQNRRQIWEKQQLVYSDVSNIIFGLLVALGCFLWSKFESRLSLPKLDSTRHG